MSGWSERRGKGHVPFPPIFYLSAIFLALTGGPSCSERYEREYKVVRITTWDEPPNTPEGRILGAIQREFDRAHPHIKVQRRPIGGRRTDDRLAFTTAMAGDNAPDCYHNAHFPTIPLWIDQGFCYPLDEYIRGDPQFEDVVEAAFAPATKDGHIYGVPSQLYVLALVYRKDLFEEAGLDPKRPPKDWWEFAQYARRLTDPKKYRYGFAILGQEWASWHWEIYVWQAGGEVTERLRDGRCRIRFTEEPAVRALQYYKDLRWKYKCVQPNPLQSYQDNRRDFVQGRAAMIISSPAWIGDFLNEGLRPEQIGIAPLPAGPTGIRATQIGGEFYIINPRSSKEKRDAAWEYIRFMTSKEAMIKRLKMMEEAHLWYPIATFYKGLRVEDYLTMPEEWGEASATSLKYGRMEYYLKDRIEPYLARPIQAVLVDPGADPREELEKCAGRVLEEVVEPFNREIERKLAEGCARGSS
ncbi:MAG TPA: sugar ABC transporter substrate-binding protein [Candidatus Latescibacteria bacterium]|nr:sugar ABC transporter substrate-binding protein [Candidatus Latescibacterota bacterium]